MFPAQVFTLAVQSAMLRQNHGVTGSGVVVGIGTHSLLMQLQLFPAQVATFAVQSAIFLQNHGVVVGEGVTGSVIIRMHAPLMQLHWSPEQVGTLAEQSAIVRHVQGVVVVGRGVVVGMGTH